MFNGYNETPLISYEFNQERIEKKHENVPKWSYGHDVGVQPGQAQPSNRHLEFWSGKSNFIGIPNIVKCSCTGCYPSTEKQSYQGDSRHRPWLPRTFPVPVNGSNEPCKLPGSQWDNGLPNQGSCYPDTNLPYVQENGRKYSYYNHSRLAEPNQPGVITSIKNTEKPKNEMSSRGQESPVLNGARHQPPVFCNPGYSLTPKRADGRNYCDAIEKYSNVASYAVDQHVARLPVVEPFTKAVPSNLSQSRVPSTGYRSVKENMPQSYMDLGYGDGRKICTEPPNEKTFSTGPLQPGAHGEYSHFNRDCQEPEGQKLFFENARHPDYYSRNNFQDVVKRNNPTLESRKDCIMNQISEMNEQHYNIPRLKYQEVANSKPCDAFYPKEFEKTRPETLFPENSGCFQRNDDGKNENVRLPPSALILNDPRFADRAQNSFTYQSSPVAYRNYLGREYQGYNAQARYEYPGGIQRNDLTHYRGQQVQQECEQLPLQQGNGFPFDSQSLNSEKSQQMYGGKNSPFVQTDCLISENRNPTYLESIREEKLNKNGATKISPLRLLRKKKFINVPQDKAPVSSLNAVPGLDVRKFWSTWAEEEEENVAPTQVVVLDCQNIDPEQAKLLHLYEADPIRAVHLETNSPGVKNADVDTEVPLEEVKTCENSVNESKTEEQTNETEVFELQQDEKAEENSSTDLETKSETPNSICPKTVSAKHFSKGKSGKENREKKKLETMDKWTEKKFDFLKRAEESKAAEILRHEEEKKKIFERRLSLQKSLKKIEKPEEKNEKKVEDRMSSFDENSQSDTPDLGNAEMLDLPTSEYRRNKFLDYSAGKVITGGDEEIKKSEEKNENIHADVEEVKKEEKVNLQLFEDSKLKEETGGEMDVILKRMSEMNFQCPDIKLEKNFEENRSKKAKSGKKPKRKKSDHQTEDEERTDKLTLETATKPTIKFSIQKSHDLKISFKVLNSSKEYSNEDLRSEDADYKGKANEDSKNSTELITLKYKSIQRDGDGRQISDSKKSRRRKKQSSKMKSPVLKIKKSRYALEEQKDPLAVDDDLLNASRKYYSDTRDGFQVQETMDSAKIKLTFKRHKGNFETEYKINSNLDKIEEVDPMREDKEERIEIDERSRKKSKRVRRDEIFAEAGVETPDCPEASDEEGSSEVQKPVFESLLEEDSRNSTTSQSFSGEHINSDFQMETSTFPEFPSTIRQNEPCEEIEKTDDETRKVDEELQEFGLINSEVDDALSEDKHEEFTMPLGEESPSGNLIDSKPANSLEKGKGRRNSEEEIKEISFDFINSTKLVEVNQISDVECSAVCLRDKNEENPERSSYKFKSERGEEEEMSFTLENSTATEEGLKGESPKSPPVLPLNLTSEKCLDTPEAIDKEETTSDLPILLPTESHEETEDNLKKNSGEPGDLKSLIENLITDDSKCDFTPLEGNSLTPKTPQDFPVPPFVPSDEKPSESAIENSKKEIEFEKKALDIEPEENHQTDFEILLEKEEDPPKNDFEELSEVFESSDNMEVSSFLENTECLRDDLDESGNLTKEYEKVDFVSEADSRAVERTVQDVLAPIASSPTSCEHESPEGSAKDPDTAADTEETKSKIVEREKEDVNVEKEILSPRAEPSTLNNLGDDSGCAECSFSTDEAPPSKNPHETLDMKITQSGEDSPLHSDVELEDGEIVDSCDETENSREKNEGTQLRENVSNCKSKIKFFVRKIERRHSIIRGNFVEKRESQNVETKKFSKAGSCPPKFSFPNEVEKQEAPRYVPVEDIPLPLGPPQEENCFYFKKCMNLSVTQTKVSETPKKSNGKLPELPEIPSSAPSQPLSESNQIETCSVPRPDAIPPSGILQRSSKIKFSFIKRSKHSKICLKPETPSQSENNVPKIEELQGNNPKDCVEEKQNSNTKECQETPIVGGEIKIGNDFEDTKHAVELTCEDLESVEAMDSMSDFIRDEFYECEDIPTSEDLTNGEDLDSEKVNDDKFRNIMQNCLDNAKKFLNVGNLKLFSCSVDDLLELDCQDSSVETSENTVSNIPRDVLLASCEDTYDDLGLCENVQSSDISMDFVPSFCTDGCPEILPVDNWPYLEEEVPSSPTVSKSDETDLIATLHDAQTNESPIEGTRNTGESTFKRFRRKSFLSDVSPVKMCTKIQRRNTIDRFAGMPCRKDIQDLKKDLMRWKKEVERESKSLKCRLSLDKITSNHGINFAKKTGGGMEKAKSLDYKSPTWQPKVMLFRISKNELRKVLESSKIKRRLSGDSLKRQMSTESKNEVIYAFKKSERLETENEVEPELLEKENSKEKSIDLLKLDNIKGSFTSGAPDLKKRKKSRFRNLHSKRKPESETVMTCNSPPAEPVHVDAEAAVAEIFKGCDSQIKNTKVCNKIDDEKRRRKSGETKHEECESRLQGSFKIEREERSKEECRKEKSERRREHRRREKSEGRDHRKHRDKGSEGGKHERRGYSHDRGKQGGKKSPKRFKRESEEKKWKNQREFSPENPWICEVCGFNDAGERVLHIKSHPFHCQSCHLAFKTEAHFISHLTKKHKDIRNQHHCLLCELSFDTEDQYQGHLETREHRHLESVEKNTINTLFTLLTGSPCPVFGLVEMKPEWLPNQAGTVHFYHQATPLSLALQYLKMHHDLMTFSKPSSPQPN